MATHPTVRGEHEQCDGVFVLPLLESNFMGTQPVNEEIRDQLLAPLIAGTQTALEEMASTHIAVRAIGQGIPAQSAGNVTALLQIASPTIQCLVLSFPAATARALAAQMLTGASDTLDDALIRDCAGEIANVVAGQAKALLAESPYRFTFTVPKVNSGVDRFQPPEGLIALVVAFGSDHGDFTMQVHVKMRN
jgi:CheY-specific phosphatase CheX